MQDLKKHEQFELEILERLNSGRFLRNLVFGGGTMLRLCHGLGRYSVDLDFWVIKDIEPKEYFQKLKTYLAESYTITDAANKFHTILLELKSPAYPRALKIEIRKELRKIETESAIAFSSESNIQVLLRVVALREMMKAKIEAFLSRREIRDVFDMEFILKKGIAVIAPVDELKALIRGIEELQKNDYAVKLGSLLDPGQRKYYQEKNFSILIRHIQDQLTG
ncbi:MAG: nucleotidyl transferase AbiEii/AbiGii toxin family protein [bacterium]|nr:nucleotidyl transferase AbiEii/AbiGii toxin family protein [bacterium]